MATSEANAWVRQVTLTGKHVTLEPLSEHHCADLAIAVADGDLWKLWYTSIPTPSDMGSEISRRLKLQEQSSMFPFAVLDNLTKHAVGMTTYMNVDSANKRLEIGSTWYARKAQGTAKNTECKLLLLTHAFEQLGCVAVEFRTSFFNDPSRRAILRVGAKLDGVLRNHSRHTDGTLRDTCVYSIIESEWPTVRSHLIFKLNNKADTIG